MASGNLLGETQIYVDYQLTVGSGAELLIESAVAEAEDKIARRLKAGYSTSSTDQGLVTGATELALGIVCKGLAAQALSDGAPAAAVRGNGWLKLATEFEASAAITLSPFLAFPVLMSGV